MPTLRFTPKSKSDGYTDATAIVKSARKAAKARRIKFPKKVSIGGAYYVMFWISYSTVAVKDLILAAAKRRGYKTIG